jgi:hypothetical protein
MQQPDYTNITRIIELQNLAEVNDHLAHSWRLLSVRTERVTDDQQQTIYVLGLPRPGPADPPRSLQDAASPAPRVSPPTPQIAAAYLPTTAEPDSSARGTTARRRRSAQPDAPSEPLRPITLISRIPLPESATSKRRRKKEVPPPPPRELSEEEQREAAGWEQVKETGKPMLVDDKLLIPGEMSPWDAIEHLPDKLREQTRKAMQDNVGGAVMGLIKHMRERLLTELGDEDQRVQYRTHSYAVQMAMAETLVRHQLGWEEVPMKDLLRQYGAVLEEDLKRKQD